MLPKPRICHLFPRYLLSLGRSRPPVPLLPPTCDRSHMRSHLHHSWRDLSMDRKASCMIRSLRCWPPSCMCHDCLLDWSTALASSSVSCGDFRRRFSSSLPLLASGKPRCWRSFWTRAVWLLPGCHWTRKTTTHGAFSLFSLPL